MALTASEEALVRQLLDQQAAILSLAGNEATITSKLGATKVTLADLVAASSLADADLLLTRQGTTDKSVSAAILAQYILAELAPDFVNVSGDTMTGALALFGGDTGVTPPQFDNDTSLATTAFVQRALGNHQSFIQYSGSQTLTGDAYGRVIEIISGAPATLTMPSPVGKSGGKIVVYNSAAGILTVNSAAGVFYGPNNPSGSASMQIQSGVQMEFVSDGTNWKTLNGSGWSSKTTNGYIKLANGVIIQWGQTTTSASGPVTVAYPIAFPNTVLCVMTSCDTTAAWFTTSEYQTPTQVGLNGWNPSPLSRVAVTARWIAIGY